MIRRRTPMSEYASDYGDTRSGGNLRAAEHFDDNKWDVDTSKKLEDLRKEYGPSVENRIAQIWQGINAQGTHLVAGPYQGKTNMALAQDYFLQHEAPLLLRQAHKTAKNPMLF